VADTPPRHLPIAVFDSGVGGLTVLRALIADLPAEDFLYLGDTARLPYGTKSPETVARYSVRERELSFDLVAGNGPDVLRRGASVATRYLMTILQNAGRAPQHVTSKETH